MQYIQKQSTPPTDWDLWFFNVHGVRQYDYAAAYENGLPNLSGALDFLINEQHGLCAYCQKRITKETGSIEHVLPKESNVELSTNYHNLVAACKDSLADPETYRKHCDKEKRSQLIPHLIFSKFAEQGTFPNRNHKWFNVDVNGSIFVKGTLGEADTTIAQQFLEVLNLNHDQLIRKRKEAIDVLIDHYRGMTDRHRKSFYAGRYENFKVDSRKEFRQFLLIYLGRKLGIN